MRRSYRDAIVGFSIVGGVILFSGFMLWLKGFRMGSRNWTITANFDNASGLSEGSPVSFRGINVGSVNKISFTPENVQATIKIDTNQLLLFKPVSAKVTTNSVLGGDVAVSLVSEGKVTDYSGALPNEKNCNNKIILCDGDILKGYSLKSISSLTEDINEIINQAGGEEIISKLINSIEKFDKTQENLDELILLSKEEIIRLRPAIEGLNQSFIHVNNILETIDDPEILSDVNETAKSLQSLTKNLDNFSKSLNDIFNDEELTNSIKEAAIGIGKFFNDIYN